MKKIIAVLIIITMTFPMYALDLIIMKNGDTYLGTILAMDVNDKVVIKLQDGTAEELKFKDINSFKKIESENTSQTANPNIVIQNTNTNENIIGSTVASVYSGPKEIIKFIPSKGKIPAKCVFQGVEYSITNLFDLKAFYNVIRQNYPNLDTEIIKMFNELILNLGNNLEDLRKANVQDGVILRIISAGVALVGLGLVAFGEVEAEKAIGGIVIACGAIGYIVGFFPAGRDIGENSKIAGSLGWVDTYLNDNLKNVVGRFNFIYAK